MISIGPSQAIAWAQYQPATNLAVSTGLTPPASGIYDLSVDRESQLAGLFDKPTATEIRALVAMNVRISFGTSITANVNSAGFDVYVQRNGTRVPFGLAGGRGRNSTAEPFDAAMSFKLQLAANDTLRLELVNLEAVQTVTGLAASTVMLVQVMELL